jgi:hypothetical protein
MNSWDGFRRSRLRIVAALTAKTGWRLRYCAVCATLVLPPPAPAGESGVGGDYWDVAMTISSTNILSREPLLVKLVWQNRTAWPHPLSSVFDSVRLGRSGWFKTCKLDPVSADGPTYSVHDVAVAPQEAFEESFWLTVGRGEDDQGGWEFLFDDPGEYTITFPGLDAPSVKVSVQTPETQQDIGARDAFGISAGVFCKGDGFTPSDLASEGSRSLREICDAYTNSIYAPYAARALAQMMWQKGRGFDVDFDEYRHYLAIIIERRPRHVLREEALYFLTRSYAFQRGREEDLQNSFKRLSKEYPNGRYTALIEKGYGVTLGLPVAPIGTEGPRVSPKPARLQLEGLQRLPEEARDVYESYWRAVAEQSLDRAEQQLDRGFVYCGIMGVRGWRRLVETDWGRVKIHEIRVAITNVENATTYSFPRKVAGEEVTWSGQICLVFAQATYVLTDSRKGEEGVTRPDQPSVMGLLKTTSGWRIISEYKRPTPNQEAADLAETLRRNLSASLGTASISDGRTDVRLADRLRAAVPRIDDDAKLAWQNRGMEVAGEDLDRPIIHGELVVQNRGSGGAMLYPMSILTRVEDKKLVLVEVRVGVWR